MLSCQCVALTEGYFRKTSHIKQKISQNPSTNLQTLHQIKVNHLHKKTLEYQHYRQQPALASPRRTARNERIPPDGFDTAALENHCPRAILRGDVGIALYTFQEVLP